MARRTLDAGALLPAVAAVFAACLLCGPASAGDNVHVVPLFADGRGNQAWVEIVSAGERETATPVVAVRDRRIVSVLENPDDNGNLVIPVPRLMRLFERARKAIRAMKRPAVNAPDAPDALKAAAAGVEAPVSAPPETPPDRTGSSAPPAKTGTDNPPSDAACRTATR